MTRPLVFRPPRLAVTDPATLASARQAGDQLAAQLRPSVTVARAAQTLGCDESTVRALLRNRELAGHLIGKGEVRKGKAVAPRGVRIFVDAIAAYQGRHAVGAAEPVASPAPRSRATTDTPGHREAAAYLQTIGVLRHPRRP